ncbi:MAG TPA: hypothetical protein VK738_20595 [Terriglobales bacterium]|nr:hypothetical protein [Terriglobales bacterium]
MIVALFALLLGWSYLDVRQAVKTAKVEIATSVAEAKVDIDAVRRTTASLKEEAAQIQSDIDNYKQVNIKIRKVQEELTSVKKDVVDLGNRTLRAHSLETTGTEPSSVSLANAGCPPSILAKGAKVAICVDGSPPFLFQRTLIGDPRPVSSLSPVGFQDVSTGPKPTCRTASRGTFYVEKGGGKEADKPLICVRQSDDTYKWIQLDKP